MRIRLIIAVACAVVSIAAFGRQEPGTVVQGRPPGRGWIHLLGGSDFKGWKYEPAYWKLEKGLLVGTTPGTPDHHYMYSDADYADFELHGDVKLVGHNSGVCIRIKPTSFDNAPGYQVDMGDGYWGCLWDERGRGMVAKYEKADVDKILHRDDWNHYYVRAEGHHIQMWLNGVKTVDIVDEPGNLTGPIGFQLAHGQGLRTEASFRNLYVRPIRPR